MPSQSISYHADGLDMVGQLFLPVSETSAPRPAVLLFPEAPGIGPNVLERAERLAQLGYVAFACDLHGGGRLLEFQAGIAEVMMLRENPLKTRDRAISALKAVAALPQVDANKIAAIGFCFGGTMALEAARAGENIAVVFGFHSGLDTKMPAEPGQIKGKVVVCIGADDPAVDAASRGRFEAEMKTAGANWQLNVYGNVVHSFTNKAADAMGRPQMARYDAQTDKRSWNEMTFVFDEVFNA